MDQAGITHITFDCYGTLVDWETGILKAGSRILRDAGALEFNEIQLLQSYVRHEAHNEAAIPHMSYREVLVKCIHGIGNDFGVDIDEPASARFANDLGDWPLFNDTRSALQRLAARFNLVILSNVDNDLFERTQHNLGIEFSAVITAQQVGSYKPALGHFKAAAAQLGLKQRNWLHVAQSLFHDHVPAKSFGLRTIWVDRPSRLVGTGLAPITSGEYDLRTTTLSEVADYLGV